MARACMQCSHELMPHGSAVEYMYFFFYRSARKERVSICSLAHLVRRNADGGGVDSGAPPGRTEKLI